MFDATSVFFGYEATLGLWTILKPVTGRYKKNMPACKEDPSSGLFFSQKGYWGGSFSCGNLSECFEWGTFSDTGDPLLSGKKRLLGQEKLKWLVAIKHLGT